MPSYINRLTDRSARAARRPGSCRKLLPEAIVMGRSFFCMSAQRGSSWIYRRMISGRHREMELHSFHEVALAEGARCGAL